MTELPGLGVPGRHHVYQLTVIYDSGHRDVGTCGTFDELSESIDTAMAAPGFVRYVVGPAGDR